MEQREDKNWVGREWYYTVAREDIKAKMEDLGCSCEILNPSGGCCLGDTGKAIKEMKTELGIWKIYLTMFKTGFNAMWLTSGNWKHKWIEDLWYAEISMYFLSLSARRVTFCKLP